MVTCAIKYFSFIVWQLEQDFISESLLEKKIKMEDFKVKEENVYSEGLSLETEDANFIDRGRRASLYKEGHWGLLKFFQRLFRIFD